MEINNDNINSEYVVVKANANNVQVVGMTRGESTKPHHTENLEQGEVLIVQFTDKTSAIKIKGNAQVYTKFGTIASEKVIK